MRGKQTMFFTTFGDIELILRAMEASFSVIYYKTGMYDAKVIPSYNSAFLIPDLGVTKFGDWNYIDNFIVIPKSQSLHIEAIPQRKGGMMYSEGGQRLNPQSVTLKIGGIYLEKENIIVAGRIATISDTLFSEEIYKFVSTKIKKEFKRIDTFYVGKEAEEKLKSGWRLVTNEKLAKGFDLKA